MTGNVHAIDTSVYYSTHDSIFEIHQDKLCRYTGPLSQYSPITASYRDSDHFIVALGTKIGHILPDNTIDFSRYSTISFQRMFSIVRLHDDILFCTDKGLYVFFMDRKAVNMDPPKFTTSFVSNNESFFFSDSLTRISIPYSQNSFSIQFFSTYFYNNVSAKFMWRIVEINKKWTEGRNQKVASFFNVIPGTYTFEVKAKNIFGIESKIVRIIITISPPWYRNIIAYIIYFLVVVTIVFLSVRYYVWRLRKHNQFLENKVNERTRELIQKNKEIDTKKTEIEIQKKEIENAHREITDSILYAQRIQSAVLPSRDYMKKLFKEFFVFYHPRNVVSGDFYWVNKLDNSVIIITADCTGHGVPGAFMSMLGISLLNEIILKDKVSSPDAILNNLRDQLVKMLNQNDIVDENEIVRDGMDISICNLNMVTKELLYAGANNKMFIVRTSSAELIELKADPMPAGYYEIMRPFKLQRQQCIKGDLVILCSDGYQDQFGGPEGKKFMGKRFKDLLLSFCDTQTNPEEIIQQVFYTWKGEKEQIDDVMVLGVFIQD